MKDKSMIVPVTILLLLGGRYFVSSTGVKDLRANENSLWMSLPKNKSKANRLTIAIDARNNYTMCFYEFCPAKFNVKTNSIDDADNRLVYADVDVPPEQLQDIFQQVTGLDLSNCPRCRSISFIQQK